MLLWNVLCTLTHFYQGLLLLSPHVETQACTVAPSSAMVTEVPGIKDRGQEPELAEGAVLSRASPRFHSAVSAG